MLKGRGVGEYESVRWVEQRQCRAQLRRLVEAEDVGAGENTFVACHS